MNEAALPPDLADEILSINAIYGDSTLSIASSSYAAESKDDVSAGAANTVLLLSPPPSHPLHPTTLLVSFPSDYPHAAPHILGPSTSDPALGKGSGHAAAKQAQDVLERVCLPDEPVIFALLAELETLLPSSLSDANDVAAVDSSSALVSNGAPSASPGTAGTAGDVPSTTLPSMHAPPTGHDPRFDLAAWTTAAPLESHRSVFVGRAIRVSNAADVVAATAALLDQDRHVARATHNIRAWRIRSEVPLHSQTHHLTTGLGNAAPTAPVAVKRPIEHQEADDDGESRAGAKVLEVMSAMAAWDVLVVVSRWYGGTKLGPERFRLIGQCARDVLVMGGWGATKTEEKRGKKKGK